ncbi:MAG: SDR family oxidoreductase [Candidatus Accumulibacter sp.]|jgi:3-oxoacyl-[acyl-carrier protein] reductase|nr:SDR family oxidoreductase [Accumulibacter sp.]
MELKGKAALVTGGGTGLGRAISLRLAREGVNVAVNYSRSKDDAEKTALDARAFGVEAIAIQADVSSAASVEKAVAETEKAFGRLDILVNNAGMTKFVPFKDLDGLDEDDWLTMYKTNAMSIFFASRAAAKAMKKNGGGRIVSTVSNAGFRPQGSSIAYSVSKAAGVHLTKCLAVALAPEINVNAVAPGLLLTRWHENTPAGQIAKINESAVLHKEVDPGECAAMYVALLKNDNITGQTVTVDSGIVI